MQGLHHQQQQLAALISVALPKDDSSSSSSASEDDESSRLAAVNSLHRTIVFPANSILVAHSASFLSQGLSQLLNDKSYSVRQAAGAAYGALCSILCSNHVQSNGRQNHAIFSTLVDCFINWALPSLRNINVGEGTAEVALESLHEFLNIGDVNGMERYAILVLKSCKELLENDRTSLRILNHILGVLTLISVKFIRCFQPHFADIVDLLLGWALVPDLAENDRHVIMDSFLQFQNHWVGNLNFSMGLLSKFLGDMDVLLQDTSQGTPQHFRRLLALLSCFSTILQSTASGMLEMNLLGQISEPLSKMVPRLLNCLSMMGRKFGWSEWIGESWRCLTLLAEILCESFSNFYLLSVDILFQSLESCRIPSLQVHGVLKTNLQLLSLQKSGLLPSSVQKVLEFSLPISQLRLHPNHLVTGSSAATYVFFLQHGNNEVVEQAMTSLIQEIELVKDMLGKFPDRGDEANNGPQFYSKYELLALIKFDLKVLLCSVSFGGRQNLIDQPELSALVLKRTEKLVSFILENLNPFDFLIQGSLDLQMHVFKTLNSLSEIEFISNCAIRKQTLNEDAVDISNAPKDSDCRYGYSFIIFGHLRKYGRFLTQALHICSPLSIKLEALDWICRFCESAISSMTHNSTAVFPSSEAFGCTGVVGNLVFSVLDSASDREPKVRSRVALTLELLLKAIIINPVHFGSIATVVLENLGEPDIGIRNSFVKLLSQVLPLTVYFCGLSDFALKDRSCLHWKQIFALRPLRKQLHSQQLVSVLSYISQRWKAPLSSWIQRLIHSCQISQRIEETGHAAGNCVILDIKVEEDILERTCLVNNLAGVYWAIHESARYCITTRLRTNLGGPTQTFAALESMLFDVVHALKMDAEQNDGISKVMRSSFTHLLPMRLLFDFVEALKKNVYNAYEGSSVLAPASRQSSLFFRANKKVCEEWFSRICEPMMNAGLALQCQSAIIQYCSLRLVELGNISASALKDKHARVRLTGDILKVLRHMALALCKSHECEALMGLQKWASITFSPLLVEENQNRNCNGLLSPFSWITGLVYQAEGQYENAAAYFTHLLQTEESLSSMGSDGVQFATARIIESYVAVSDWMSLESWLLELQTLRAKHAGKSYSGALTMTGIDLNALHAFARFDEGDFTSVWSYLDLTPKSSSELTLDSNLALQRSEQMLLQAMLLQNEEKGEKVSNEIQKAKLMMEELLSIVPLDGLPESADCLTHLHCIYAFEEGCSKLKGCEDKLVNLQSILTSYIQSVHSPINSIRQDCSPWLKILRVYKTAYPTEKVTLYLSMNLLSLSRKKKNFLLANRLKNHLNDHALNCSDKAYRDFLTSKLQYEGILLMHAENKIEDAFMHLWSFCHPSIVSSAAAAIDSNDSILKAKACLKLSSWLRSDYSGISLENFAAKMLSNFNINNISPPIIEEIVGTFTKISTQICPTMGKSWMSYASWCYDQARVSLSSPQKTVIQSCSFSPILVPELVPERFTLTEEEVSRVEIIISSLFGKYTDAKDSIDVINSVLKQAVSTIEATAGIDKSTSGERLSTMLLSRLVILFSNSNVELDENDILSSVNDLIDIWWCLRKRRVSLYGNAAHGYIQYLSFSSSKLCGGQLTGFDSESLKQRTSSYTLRATLYVLDILLNYGVELKATLEPALSTVPLFPWQEITPQLFARLSSHPEPEVRKQLEGLLMMLARLSPWSIVYPTLVDVDAYEQEPSEELQCILGCLSKLYPILIQDVQLMINELGNVIVLWEELWLSTLQDLHSDVMRRINLLKEEAKRIAENVTLSDSEKHKINAAKYSAMMAPIVVALERRLTSTSRKPETTHEIWFHEEFTERLKSAILGFKNPPISASALENVWKPFDDIAALLATYQRKSSISLAEVAPKLAFLSSSSIPMPGFEKQIDEGTIVTVASFSNQIDILPTKTKPKKLVIVGSNGQSYTYLLKGREDLRLDARIMQLLQAINGFLCSSSSTCKNSLSIRYYTVTPISGRAGLIQWVENVISIYSVFKSWQLRMQQGQISASSGGSTKNAVPLPVPRPSDMFYGKIIPALKEKGIRRVISRRDWPHDVKRKVLLDLMKEAPRQLLHQEIWCASEGFQAFRSKLNKYAGSVAAMSMVGHILGLGDRHLDNILMDFFSGQIVHIDYNVCFDKGQRLKIPEIVPFRLTQTIEAALGLTGIEGSFRADCESVLSVLRKNKDVILMLLEVFAWDPLVEWTRGDFHDEAAIGGEERKGMELAVSLSLFASRFQEIRVPLQEHHDLLLAALPAVESALERFSEVLEKYELVSALYFHADKERSSLILHETTAKLNAAEVTTTSEKIRSSFEIQAREFSQAKGFVSEKAQELIAWIEKHGSILDACRSSLIPKINVNSNKKEALSLTFSVLAADVPLAIVPEPTQAQCHDIDMEVSQVINELNHGLTCVVTRLQSYSLALQRILPLNYLTTSPVHIWAQILQLSVTTLASDIISLARKQGSELIAKVNGGDNLDSIKRFHYDLCLKVERCAKEMERVEQEYDELVNSIGSQNELKAKDHLLTSFMNYVKHEEKEKLLSFLNEAASSFYNKIKNKVLDINNSTDFGMLFCGLEEQLEKCVIVAGAIDELRQCLSKNIPNDEANWVSVFRSGLLSCKSLTEQMIEIVLPDVIRSFISVNSEVTDAFGCLSRIRGSIDTSVEQLIEVELERVSLLELEKNYFLEVGSITEKQLALGEAALKGRDNLSWEEAEEIASREEACRVQLDQLHQSWSQKDIRSLTLNKRETAIKNTLVSSENHFQSLVDCENEKGKALLTTLLKPFSELQIIDQVLSPFCVSSSSSSNRISELADILNSGYPISKNIWKMGWLLGSNSFFIWQVGVVAIFLDSCIHEVASSDQNLGFDQLNNVLKKNLELQLQARIAQYVKDRFCPALLTWLDKESGHSNQPTESSKEIMLMLDEFCNANETARAARSAAYLMKRQVDEMIEDIRKTSLEIVQMEWMHDVSLIPSRGNRLIFQKFLPRDDDLYPVILDLTRPKLMESMQSGVSTIARSIEYLEACEIQSVKAEGQLERAMGWACGGPSSSGSGSSGIPSSFHEHLVRRRNLLREARDKASEIVRFCIMILDFEASRDGIFRIGGDVYPIGNSSGDPRAWQQAYLNALIRLDVTYHSFTRIEQEWKLAQRSIEAASSGLYTATTELSIASVKAKSASGDLQGNVVSMRECAYETSVALSAFSRISKGHTALTSDCGSMLEEVLAITEGLHDVHTLAKDAASLHYSLMEDLLKANSILFPLEVLLSKDVATMTEVMAREREMKMEISQIHGQAIYQSYCSRVREAFQSLKPLVPSLTFSVKELHSMMTRMARAASLHAGNLHKALEGLAESQEVRSQELDLSDVASSAAEHEVQNKENVSKFSGEISKKFINFSNLCLQEKGWVSPPGSIYSSDSQSGTSLNESTEPLSINEQEEAMETLSNGSTVRECTKELDLVPFSEFDFPVVNNADSTYTELAGKIEINKHLNEEISEIKSGGKDEASSLTKGKAEDENQDFLPNTDTANRVSRGKNAYAVSVLRRVEMKLDGRDIADNREISIAEQVDYLLKQAMSLDNLCNMYEGWTPWI